MHSRKCSDCNARRLLSGSISKASHSLVHPEFMPLFGGLLVLKLENEKDNAWSLHGKGFLGRLRTC